MSTVRASLAEPPVIAATASTWVGAGNDGKWGSRQPDPLEVAVQPACAVLCSERAVVGQHGWQPSQPRPRRPAGNAAVGWIETVQALVHSRGVG